MSVRARLSPTMLSLALSSVRKRPGRLLATLLSAFLGAAIIMTFGSLHDTAGATGVDPVSAEVLTTAASVVGGYGSLLVFFAVASALTVNVRQRADEIALLRRTGATPAQIRRMVVGEAAAVAVAGALLAVVPALFGGRVLLGLFQDGGQVADGVEPVFGTVALVSGASVTLLASVGAAFLAVRRATRTAAGAPVDAGAAGGRGRTVAASAALLAGTAAICGTFALDSTAPALMAAPSAGAILLSLGLALLSPALLRTLLGALERPLTALTGASGYLTIHHMRSHSAQLSGMLTPLTMFVGIAAGTLSMQSLETEAIKASGLTESVDDKTLETLNFTVVGIIVVFCCIMLINSLYAATSYRAGEFGRQRLAGATPAQVLGTVGLEGLVLTVTGVFCGTVAALAGLAPFSLVRTDTLEPGRSPWIWLGVAAVATAATLLTGLTTARAALKTPAVTAITPTT